MKYSSKTAQIEGVKPCLQPSISIDQWERVWLLAYLRNGHVLCSTGLWKKLIPLEKVQELRKPKIYKTFLPLRVVDYF